MKTILYFIFLVTISLAIQAQPLSMNDFLADPSHYDAQISPNGRYLAEVIQVEKQRLAIIRDLTKEGFPVVRKVGDNIIRPFSLAWANDERLLVYLKVPLETDEIRRKDEKNKEYDLDDSLMYDRLISIGLDNKEPVSLLTDRTALRRQINLSKIRHFLPKDDKNILMTALYHEKISLFKVNVYDGTSEIVEKGSGDTILFVSDLDGNPKYRIDLEYSARALHLFEMDENKQWVEFDTLFFNREEESFIDVADFVGMNKNGNIIFIQRNEKTGFKEILERDKNTKKLSVLASLPNQDIVGIIFKDDEAIGYFYENNDVIAQHYFDQEKQVIYDKISKSIGEYGFVSKIRNVENQYFIAHANGLNFSGIFLYDNKNNVLNLYADEYQSLTTEKLAKIAKATFITRDGLKERIYILLPPNYQPGKAYPLIMMPHGGPHIRDYANFDIFAQYIASMGYIVAKPNFRGSTGYGKAFEEAAFKDWGGVMQNDIQDAANFLVKKGFADPQRICIVGISYGGYAALMGLVKHNESYQCAVSINGPTDLLDLVRDDLEKFKHHKPFIKYISERYGDPSKDKEYLIANSPYHQSKKIQKPTLIVAGELDYTVATRHSTRLANKIGSNHKGNKLLLLKDSGHNVFRYKKDKLKVYEEVTKFLQKNLPVSEKQNTH